MTLDELIAEATKLKEHGVDGATKVMRLDDELDEREVEKLRMGEFYGYIDGQRWIYLGVVVE